MIRFWIPPIQWPRLPRIDIGLLPTAITNCFRNVPYTLLGQRRTRRRSSSDEYLFDEEVLSDAELIDM
jgi:hypothetical protein